MFTSIKLYSCWFVTNETIKKLLTALYADDNILYFNEDSGDVILSYNKMGILSIDLNNINLDDSNCNEDDPGTITHVRLLDWHNKFEKRNTIKKKLNEQLILIAWHPRRWWNFCLPENDKKIKK